MLALLLPEADGAGGLGSTERAHSSGSHQLLDRAFMRCSGML